MRRSAIIIGLFVGWFVNESLAQKPQTSTPPLVSEATSKAYIKHTSNGEAFVTEDAQFDFVHVLHDNGKSFDNLLVLHTDHNEWSEGQEGVKGSVTVKAWRDGRSSRQKPSWTFNAPGNAGRALSTLRMFQVSSVTCCSSPFENIYFSLLDGKQLYTTNGTPEKGRTGQDSGLVEVLQFESDKHIESRFIGFGSYTLKGEGTPALQYGTDKTIRQRFLLLGREYGDNFDVPEVFLTEDGTKLTDYLEVKSHFNLTVVLKFPDGPEVRIPIENDVVRADKATLPPGYSLKAESVK